MEVIESRLLGRSSHVRLQTSRENAANFEIHARIATGLDPLKVGKVSARIDPRFTFVFPEGPPDGARGGSGPHS